MFNLDAKDLINSVENKKAREVDWLQLKLDRIEKIIRDADARGCNYVRIKFDLCFYGYNADEEYVIVKEELTKHGFGVCRVHEVIKVYSDKEVEVMKIYW